MEDNEGLLELLQSATTGRSLQGSATRLNDRDNFISASPLQNSLLATLLPNPSREGPPIVAKKLSAVSKSPSPLDAGSHLMELLRPASGYASQVQSAAESLQELHLDAVKCDSTAISQVKHPSHRANPFGNLITATRHCIAYVLNDRKIRLIAQENAAMGLMDLHDATRVPIVDIAWSMQESAVDSGAGLHAHPSQQLLASVSQGGEVCIGAVYAESNSTLVYEPISATTFPELQPARGVVWNDSNATPLLVVYGAGPELFLLSVGAGSRVATLMTDLDSIHAAKFGDDGGFLYVASLEKIAILSVQSFDKTFSAQTISLMQGARRVWLLSHCLGMIAVAAIENEQLHIIPLYDPTAEVIISMPLPGSPDQQFAVFDQISSTLCVGSLDSSRIICVCLSSFSEPIVSAGSWANDSTSVSVFATSQLHSVFSKVGNDADMFLYAYHKDSVKMHRLSIDWESTKSATEPAHLPSPSQDILRKSSRSSASGGATPTPLAIASTDIGIAPGKQNIKTKPRPNEDSLRSNSSTTSVQDTQKTVTPNYQQELSQLLNSRILPAVESNMNNLEQKIVQKCEDVLNRSVGKPDKLAAAVANQIGQSLRSSLDKSVKEAVENSLLPGLQAIMTDLVGQLSANLSQAIVDSTIEQYKVIMSELTQLRGTVVELQHCAFKLPSAQELAQSVSNEIRQSFSPVAAPQLTRAEELDSQIRAGDGCMALIQLLEVGDIPMLNWILPRLDAASLLESPDMRPPVMLSLIQQLSFDLATLTEVKLDWLAELFTVMDPSISLDPKLADTCSTVLDELFSNLRVIFAETPSNSPVNKKVKTVMRLVRMMMTS
ncbi:Enhancer of mRNA-decapping protein [Paramicrosporidium saccamoebae]|uniref:Enhancer of mRNA-decapping protein n=1 Tax=Paramicrosporidium saccamoebae TaxID=1246581 RepID=A0A2H9TFJ0_9FUNG|nr:Enhancer of mRNA-decapping protein [Paramicrosporidium saccamoebae]